MRERKRLKRETQAQIANIQTLMGLNRNLERVSQECIKLNERFKLFGDLHEEIQDLLSGEEQAQDHQVYINHRGPTQSVCVADCYLIANVLDLPFASPIAKYR